MLNLVDSQAISTLRAPCSTDYSAPPVIRTVSHSLRFLPSGNDPATNLHGLHRPRHPITVTTLRSLDVLHSQPSLLQVLSLSIVLRRSGGCED